MVDLQLFKMENKLKNIKWVFTDCDGVLTDGGVYYGEQGEVLKKFNIKDGMGVERLRKLADIQTGIITGEVSPSVQKRAEKLGITELYLGIKDKSAQMEKVINKLGLKPEEVAYIGDDINDLPVIPFVGYFFCPNDAQKLVKEKADWVLETVGGAGCFREMAEIIISAK